jgi:hypothetical protein
LISICRFSGILSIYINGTKRYNGIMNNNNFAAVAPLKIGARNADNLFRFTGYLDGLFILKGQALRTKNFTPPSTAFVLD